MASLSVCVAKHVSVGSLYSEQKESRNNTDAAGETLGLLSRSVDGSFKHQFSPLTSGVEHELTDGLHIQGNEGSPDCKGRSHNPQTRSMVRGISMVTGASNQPRTVAYAARRSGVLEKQSSGSIDAALVKKGGQKLPSLILKEMETLSQVPDVQIQGLGGAGTEVVAGSAADGRGGDNSILPEFSEGNIQHSFGAKEMTESTRSIAGERRRTEEGSQLPDRGSLSEAEPSSKRASGKIGAKVQTVREHSAKLKVQRDSVQGKRETRVREIVALVMRVKGSGAMSSVLRRWVRHLSLVDVNRVLKELREVEIASCFFAWVKKSSGHRPDVFTYTSFLKILVRAGRWEEAGELMEEMSSPEVDCRPDNVTYSVLIAGASRAGLHMEVTKWFNHMKISGCRPDAVTYNTVISASVRAGDLNGAEAVFREMEAVGCQPDQFSYSILASAYGKAGLLGKAISLFQAMEDAGHKPDRVAYSIIIDACAKQGAADQAQILFQKMRSARCPPDGITWNSLILAYAKAHRQNEAEESLAAMRAAGFEPDKFTYSSMMWMYAQAGLPEKTEQLLQSLTAAGVAVDDHIRVAVMSAHANAGNVERAEELFLGVVLGRMRASQVAFSAMVTMYGRAGLPEKAEGVMRMLRAKGLKPNEVMYSTLLDMYGRCGKPKEAAKVLTEMESEGVKPNLLTYNCLVAALGSHGMLDAAALCLDRMKTVGLRPDAFTYSTLILACGKAKQPDHALQHFHDMLANNCRPDIVVYGAIVTVLYRAKRLQEARKMFAQMRESGVKPDEKLRKVMARVLTELGLFAEAEEVRSSLGSHDSPKRPRRSKKANKPILRSTMPPVSSDPKSKSSMQLEEVEEDAGHRGVGEVSDLAVGDDNVVAASILEEGCGGVEKGRGMKEVVNGGTRQEGRHRMVGKVSVLADGDDGIMAASISEEGEGYRGVEKGQGMNELVNGGARREGGMWKLGDSVVKDEEFENRIRSRTVVVSAKERCGGVGKRQGVKGERVEGELNVERRRHRRRAKKSTQVKDMGSKRGVESGSELSMAVSSRDEFSAKDILVGGGQRGGLQFDDENM